MNPLSLFRESDIKRFWNHVHKGESNECWLWTAGCFAGGYGSFSVDGQRLRAHVIAYALTIGIWPTGLEIRHTCDFPKCCNPLHLIDGTHAENMRDMVDRGRHHPGTIHGEQNGRCKLSDKEVAEIRRLGLFFGATEIRRMMKLEHRVTRDHIGKILRGRR